MTPNHPRSTALHALLHAHALGRRLQCLRRRARRLGRVGVEAIERGGGLLDGRSLPGRFMLRGAKPRPSSQETDHETKVCEQRRSGPPCEDSLHLDGGGEATRFGTSGWARIGDDMIWDMNGPFNVKSHAAKYLLLNLWDLLETTKLHGHESFRKMACLGNVDQTPINCTFSNKWT